MRSLSFALWFALSACAAFPSRVVLTRDDLQQRIEEKFPIEKSHPLASVSLTSPRIILDASTGDRIGISVDARVRLAIVAQTGTAVISGKLIYDQGTFFLTDCRLESLEVPGIAPEDLEVPRRAIDTALVSAIDRIPVHELSGPKESTMKAFIQSVKVESGSVVIDLGL